MLVNVRLVDGRCLEINLDGTFDYEQLVHEITSRLGIPKESFFLFHNKSQITRFTKIDSQAQSPINITLIDTNSIPNRQLPRGDWSFMYDLGRFVPLQPSHPANSVFEPPNSRRVLRQIIPNIGYEYGNPFSMRPTLELTPRADHATEALMMKQDRSGITEDQRELNQRRMPSSDADLEQFRLSLPLRQQDLIARLASLGFGTAVVTRVFCEMGGNERAMIQCLNDLLPHV